MAVLTVEIFAHAPHDADPLSETQRAGIRAALRCALAPLCVHTTGSLPLLGYEVTPYAGAALIEALCLADSGLDAVDILGARLEAAMSDAPEVFRDWSLHAGRTRVEHADS
ncbi:hypothetical protein [Streptomonospora arabica]|uniref:Uncharacterized protein n=1 Tax=Streptomonospora arabica TaxID=412417 RepID=A0ABV9SJ51_9ACTN